MDRRTVVIVGGGTAGHVYPALAIAEAYRQAIPAVDVLFVGTPCGCEKWVVPQSGYRIEMVAGRPFFGAGAAGKARAIGSVMAGMLEARPILRAHRAHLVIGLGGYACAGTVLAAWSLGVPAVVHESNLAPGLANRMLGRFVDRVYVGFEAAGRPFPARRRVVTGNPVRPEVARLSGCDRRPPGLAERPARVLVTGGSQGAAFLNRHVPPLLERVARMGVALDVRHQVGDHAPEPVAAAYARAGLPASTTPYLEDVAAAYAWADFAIARSGSATIAELAVAGLPSLLVPSPSAASDHQTANATAVAAAGAAAWIAEAAWETGGPGERVARLLRDADAWSAMSRAARQLATPNAARDVVAHCEALLAERAR